MPVAISVATRSGLSAAAVGDLACATERGGLDGFFLAESAADSISLAHAALARTATIPVGTAITNARLRHPAAAAMAAATLDELSGGRFRLGLGVSNAAFNEAALGMAPIHPVQFMRDYVADFRRALGGVVPLDRSPRTASLPVSIAAMQPRMLRLAGEVADGVVLSLTTPATLPAAVAEVATGAARAGRTLRDLTVSCVMPCCFDTDGDRARLAGRNVVLGYARHPAAAQLFGDRGFADRLPMLIEALDRGDHGAAHRLVDPQLVDEFVLVDRERAADRIARYVDAGIDLPILFPIPAFDDWETTLQDTIAFAPALIRAATSSRKVLT